MKIKSSIQTLTLCTLTFASMSSQAGFIGTRTDLNNLLGTSLVFEDFETPTITSQVRYSGGPYNASVNFAGLGTGLVVDGITFQRNPDYPISNAGYRGIDWNPSGYFGSSSQRLSGAGGSGGASIRNDFQFIFTVPVTAFGLDLTAYSGFASTGKVSIFDTAGILLATTDITGTVAGTFFGWENSSGIGKVFFHDNPNANYIQFDNLGFGAASVPIPGAVWLFVSAMTGLVGISRLAKNV